MGMISSHFRDAPERRVQVILYLMLGLAVYFILDLGTTRSTSQTTEIKKDLRGIQDNIQSRSALIDQTQYVQNELQELQVKAERLRMDRNQRIEDLLQCRQQTLLDVLNDASSQENPFEGIRRGNSFPGTLAQYEYQVEIVGEFAGVIALLERLDRSPCSMHVTRWTLVSEEETGNRLQGTLYLRLYQTGEAE